MLTRIIPPSSRLDGAFESTPADFPDHIARNRNVSSVGGPLFLPVGRENKGFQGKPLEVRDCDVVAAHHLALCPFDTLSGVGESLWETDSDEEFFDAVEIQCDTESEDEWFDARDSMQVGERPEFGSEDVKKNEEESDGQWILVENKRRRRNRGGNRKSCQVAESGERGKVIGLQKKDTLASLKGVTDAEYQLCHHSFAQLTLIKEDLFSSLLDKYSVSGPKIKLQKQYVFGSNLDRSIYQRFHQMTRGGLSSINCDNDDRFLANCFHMLLRNSRSSQYIIYISLVIDRLHPGFLKLLGGTYLKRLFWVEYRGDSLLDKSDSQLKKQDLVKSFEKTYQLPDGGVKRFGWDQFEIKARCTLFFALSNLFKRDGRKDLVQDLVGTVHWSWLDTHFNSALEEIKKTEGRKIEAIYLLKEASKACSLWLRCHLWLNSEAKNGWAVKAFVQMMEQVFASLSYCNQHLATDLLWLYVFEAVYFQRQFSTVLGYERAANLLKVMLKMFEGVSGIDTVLMRLRLHYSGIALMMCDELSQKKNQVEFVAAWAKHCESIKRNLEICSEATKKNDMVGAPVVSSGGINWQDRASCNVLMKWATYHRLTCEASRFPSRLAGEKIQGIIQGFSGYLNSKIDHFYDRIVIELGKWYLLAGQYHEGTVFLKNHLLTAGDFRQRKARLLGQFGAYTDAIKEYHCCKTLLVEEDDKRKANDIDNEIAMLKLVMYQSDGSEKHLVEAFHIQLDVLRRCGPLGLNKYIGALSHIVTAITGSSLVFDHFRARINSLPFLIGGGYSVKNWDHLCSLLSVRHKDGLTRDVGHKTVALATQIYKKYGL